MKEFMNAEMEEAKKKKVRRATVGVQVRPNTAHPAH